MKLRPSALLLGLALAFASFSPAPPGGPAARLVTPVSADPQQLAAEEQALQTAARTDDAVTALDYFRKRTPPPTQREHLQALIRDLGDNDFEVRKSASTGLVASGPVAVAPLRAAARSPDAEVARRAEECLAAVRREGTAALVQSGVKLVVRRRPPDTVAVLLAYVPFAEEEDVAEDIRTALAGLTVEDGRADPALLRALESADPAGRAEAGIVLARANLADTRPAVRRLLTDDASVRLRVGRALVGAKDRDAIPVLIELFDELSGDDRWEIEDLLERVAGERAPAVPRNDSRGGRQERREAWRGWWQAHGDRADLTYLAEPPRPSGRTLLVEGNFQTFDGQLMEVSAEGQPLWRAAGFSLPIAAQHLGGDRVLLAEYGGKRVVELDAGGNVVWEKDLPANPVAVQRLPDGTTFVACRNRLMALDRDGKETSDVRRPVRDVVGARKHPDGSTVLLTHDGFCRWLNAAGEEVSRFPAGGPHVMGVGLDVLPNKRVLVPRFGEDRVTEYDRAGRVIWEATVPGPASAERLPDGHTLVGCSTPPLVVELDRVGRVVWQHQPERTLIQATRR
jgi:hypothetical protein